MKLRVVFVAPPFSYLISIPVNMTRENQTRINQKQMFPVNTINYSRATAPKLAMKCIRGAMVGISVGGWARRA